MERFRFGVASAKDLGTMMVRQSIYRERCGG